MNGKMMKQQLYLFFMFLLFAEIVESANATKPKTTTTTTKAPTATTSEYIVETWLYAVISIAFSVVALTILAAILIYYWFWCPTKEEKEAAAAEAKARRKKKMKKAKKPSKNAVVKEDEEEEEQEQPKPKKKKKASDSVNVKLQREENMKGEEKRMPSSSAKPEKPEESNLQQQKQPTPKPKPKPKRTVTQVYSKTAETPIIYQSGPEAAEDGKIQQTKTEPTTETTTGTLTTQDYCSHKSALQSITGSYKTLRQNPPETKPAVRRVPTTPKNVIINGKFDYHYDEPSKFQKTLVKNIPDSCIPPLTQYINFWSCIEHLTAVPRFSQVFVNFTIGPSNIFFMIRDLVADEIKYMPFQILANRILEPMKNDGNKNADEKKKIYILRVYIISYAPFTMEIHCRGKCPQFLFEIFKCGACSFQLKRYQKNNWLIPLEEGYESWEEFVCKVKRIPVNTHQVLCFNGPKQKPKNCEEVNHIFVIRGDFKSTNICPCIRECTFFYQTHRNSFKLQPARAPSTSKKANI